MYSNTATRSIRGSCSVAQRFFCAPRIRRSRWRPWFRIPEIPCIPIISSPSPDSGGRGSKITEQLFAIAEAAQDPLGIQLRSRDAVPWTARSADEDLSHGTSGHLDSDHGQKFHGARARPVCCALAHLQIAAGHHLRRLEDCLYDAGPAPILGCISVAAPLREILDFSGSQQRCLGSAACGPICKH